MAKERVRDISEFQLIERLRAVLPTSVKPASDVLIGIGDDAAVWKPTVGESVLVTSDSLIENVHFRLDWTAWGQLGRKALAVNISDIAAMGGVPVLATVSLSLTGNERVTDLERLYRGIGTEGRAYGVQIAGGDIVRSPNDFGIHITLLGQTRFGGRFLTRSGAQPGDVIAVTGYLGASAAGLALLQELSPQDARYGAATKRQLIVAHLLPVPLVLAGKMALEYGATACMDLSDGLFGDLPKILQASGVNGEIDIERIPVASSIRALFPDRYLEFVTRGGEDYELLLTISPDAFESLRDAMWNTAGTLVAIGTVGERTSTPTLFVRAANENLSSITSGGYDHFQRPSDAR